jgi:uncharacterized protein (TIGR03435 family)
MNYGNMSIASLVKNLQHNFQQPIVDRTGLTGEYDFSLNVSWEPGTLKSDAYNQALSAQLGLELTPGTVPLDLLMVQADNEAAPSSSLPTENQLSSNVVAQGGAQTTISEQPALELARLRPEAVRLRNEVAQLRQLTGEMANAQTSTDPLVIDENVWSIHNSSDLALLPPAFILRPTRFAGDHRGFTVGIRGKNGSSGGMSAFRSALSLGAGSASVRSSAGMLGGGGAPTGGNSQMQILGPNISFAELMATAFDVDVYNVVIPPGAPAGGFDLLMTGPDATRERLQAEIKSQLGYDAHIESRPTNVLLLTLRQAGAPGLQPSNPTARGGGGGGGGSTAGMSMHYNNSPISALISHLQHYFDPPIIDRSGLAGRFDISLNVGASGNDAIKQSLTEQLGLVLTPSLEPLDLLVVEADKEN